MTFRLPTASIREPSDSSAANSGDQPLLAHGQRRYRIHRSGRIASPDRSCPARSLLTSLPRLRLPSCPQFSGEVAGRPPIHIHIESPSEILPDILFQLAGIAVGKLNGDADHPLRI